MPFTKRRHQEFIYFWTINHYTGFIYVPHAIEFLNWLKILIKVWYSPHSMAIYWPQESYFIFFIAEVLMSCTNFLCKINFWILMCTILHCLNQSHHHLKDASLTDALIYALYIARNYYTGSINYLCWCVNLFPKFSLNSDIHTLIVYLLPMGFHFLIV